MRWDDFFLTVFVPVDMIHAPWFTTDDSLYIIAQQHGERGEALRGMGSEAVVAVDSIAGRRQALEPHLAGTTRELHWPRFFLFLIA
jgi:hypothetical protein